MTVIAIFAYKPLPGFDTGFKEVLSEHVPLLREEGYITDRDDYLMQTIDGTIIEVFEWKSEDSLEEARQNPKVMTYWSRLFEYSDLIALKDVMEFHESLVALRGVNLDSYM